MALCAPGRSGQDAAAVAVPGALVALAERLQGVCLGRGCTVAVAESCTGGLVAATITAVPGSSGYFLGGVVSYADSAKVALLGVPKATLDAHGAVSAQVAVAMAAGARARFGTTLALSITGVAGPDGGSEAKPVGLTYLGLADEHGTDVRRFTFGSDRAGNREAAAHAGLEWLIEAAEVAGSRE
ncbi:MAG: CinA family protein [Chloroflexota bacterium]